MILLREDRVLANFLFCVVAFGSFEKVSASRRGRAFANVQNQERTKNMTKKLCAVGFIHSSPIFTDALLKCRMYFQYLQSDKFKSSNHFIAFNDKA